MMAFAPGGSKKKVTDLVSKYKIYKNNSEVELLDAGDLRIVVQADTAVTTTELMTGDAPGTAKLRIYYSGGGNNYLYDVGVIGKGIKRLSGSQGLIHDSFVDYGRILNEGVREFQLENNYIVTEAHVNRLADFWKKYLFTKKHRYQLSISGRRFWYALGEWYTLQIGSAGLAEYIDSTVMCTGIQIENGRGDQGRTVLTFQEVEQNWVFDSNAVARRIASGSPLLAINRGNTVTVCPSDLVTTANYYCTGTADETVINGAISYINSIGGGTVKLLRGTFFTAATIVLMSNCLLLGEGEKTLIYADTADADVIECEADSSGAGVSGIKIENTTTTAYDKYLIDLNSSDECMIDGCIMDYPKCAGVNNDGANNSIINNTMSGGGGISISVDGINQLVVDYLISFGSKAVCTLSETKAVIVYASTKLRARVLTISGTTITAGTEYELDDPYTGGHISCCAITGDSFVATWRRGVAGSAGYSIVGTVSGDVIMFGSPTEFETGATAYTAVSRLTDTSVIIAYMDDDDTDKGKAVVGTVSGTTISFGAIATFNAGTTAAYTISCTALGSLSFIVSYVDTGNSSYGTCCAATISGTTISFGAEVVFNSGTTFSPNINILSSTSAVITYMDDSDNDYIKAVLATISGSTATVSAEFSSTVAGYNLASVSIDANNAIIYFRSAGASPYTLYAIKLFISGTKILFENVCSIGTSDSYSAGLLCKLSNNILIYTYSNSSLQDEIADLMNYKTPFAITTSGRNAIIQANHIIADDTEIQEVGIYVSGDENIVANNQIDGLYDTDRNIKVGLLVTSDSNRSGMSSNKISNCLNYGLVVYGTNTQVNNTMCFNNGDDTGIANENEHNYLDEGTGTQL